MSKGMQRVGSMFILLLMALLGLLIAGCIVTTNINIGHHQEIKKKLTADDMMLDQEYDIKAGGNRR